MPKIDLNIKEASVSIRLAIESADAPPPEQFPPQETPPPEAPPNSIDPAGDPPIQASVNSAKRLAAWLASMGIGLGAVAAALLNFAKEHPVLAAVIIISALTAATGASGYYQHLLHKSDRERRAYAADKTKNDVV